MISANSTGVIIMLIGLYGLMTKSNLIKQVLSMDVTLVGVMLFFAGIGYVEGGSIPIVTSEGVVNPLPAALILPSLVVEVALTSLALLMILRMKGEKK